MKPRKPVPPFELSFTLNRKEGGIADCVSLREEAWSRAEALEAVAFLTRRMVNELAKDGKDNEDA
jgi:hypothetical protein